MNMKPEIQQALTAAMKARDEDAKRTLRLLLSSIKLAEVEEGGEISDERILSILQKEVKTREDSIEEAKRAHRDDLVEAAEREMVILDRFLPKQMSPDELSELVKGIVDEVGAETIQDMGRVMKELIPRLAGRASGQDASKAVREMLQNK